MNKIFTFSLAALLMLPVCPVITSCSDDKEEDEMEVCPPDNPEGENNGLMEIPEEVLEKVMEIYSKASIEPQEVTTVHQLAILTSICATRKGDGPITVTPAQLNGEQITLITLGGTEFVEGQATTLLESQLAAFGKPNDYLRALVRLFDDGTVPADKPVVITGISLGGMIAQQLLSEEKVRERNEIRAIVTFGSPLTLPIDRHGVKVVRFADVHDRVPELGESILSSGLLTNSWISKTELQKKMAELNEAEKIIRTSKYTEVVETHALSYIEDNCWNDVDFLGSGSKDNVLVLNEAMKFYDAPKLSE